MLLSVWCLSVAYIGPKSRTERPKEDQSWHRGSPRHTWLGHHFQGQKVKVTRRLYSPPCWRVRRLQRWVWERVGRGKLLLRCRLLGGTRHFGAHGGEDRGGGIPWRPPSYNLLGMFSPNAHQLMWNKTYKLITSARLLHVIYTNLNQQVQPPTRRISATLYLTPTVCILHGTKPTYTPPTLCRPLVSIPTITPQLVLRYSSSPSPCSSLT